MRTIAMVLCLVAARSDDQVPIGLAVGLPPMDCLANGTMTLCPTARARVQKSSPARVHVLIGLVVGSAWWSRMMIVENMLALDAESDIVKQRWLVAVYDSNDPEYVATKWRYERLAAERLNVTFDVYAAIESGMRCPFCPKLQFQIKFVQVAAEVDFVWIPDADISFRAFNVRNFWAAHHAAGRPMIAQPTIIPSTQFVPFCFNKNQWDHCKPAPPELSYVRVTYVEQQAPVFDARFFRWLMPRLADLADEQRKTGASWGHCSIWCGAALAYLTDVIQKPYRVPCAVIFEEIDHRNMHSINKTLDFYSVSRKIKDGLAHGQLFADDHPVSHFVRFQALLLRDHSLYDVQNTNLWSKRGSGAKKSKRRQRRYF